MLEAELAKSEEHVCFLQAQLMERALAAAPQMSAEVQTTPSLLNKTSVRIQTRWVCTSFYLSLNHSRVVRF